MSEGLEVARSHALLLEMIMTEGSRHWDVRKILTEAGDQWSVGEEERSCSLFENLAETEPRDLYAKLKDLVLNPPFFGAWIPAILKEVADLEGHVCFRFEWDSGGPGAGAGTGVVYRLRNRFLAIDPVTYELRGPFDRLEEALEVTVGIGKSGAILVNEATREIHCSEWTDEDLILRLDLSTCNPQPKLILNDTTWDLEKLRQEQERLRNSSSTG